MGNMPEWISAIYDKWYIVNLPTILILFFFVLYLIFGAIRGSRKGTILLIHMAIAMGISAVLFFIMTSKFTDGQLITFINSFIPGGTIQGFINVDSSCDTIEKIILALVEKEAGSDYQNVLTTLMPYISVIVEMVFRFAVFLVCVVFYWVLKFILYVFYFLFYPQRRYKRRINDNYEMGRGLPYEKHSFKGMLVGAVRGIICLGIFCSFFGSIFFIASSGVESPDDYQEIPSDATQEEINAIKATNLYYMIRNYGNSGLFGILNTVRDSEDVPYYLFFANNVIKGSLSVNNPDVDGNYYLINELADYMTILNRCVDLSVKYNFAELQSNWETNPLIIFQQKEFCEELNVLIDEFKTPEFTRAIVIGLVKTITKDYESYVELLVETGTETADMLMDIVTAIFEGEDGVDLTKLVKESDVRLVMKTSVSLLSVYADYSIGQETTAGQMEMVGMMMEEIVPYLKQLSFFTTEDSKGEFNNLMYKVTSCAAKYVKFEIKGEESTLADYLAFDNIDWSDELVKFLNTGSDVLVMISRNNLDFNDITSILNMFDSTNEQYENNMKVLESIGDALGESKLLSDLFQSEIAYVLIEETLSTSLVMEISIPRDLSWGNAINSTGEVIKGEISNLIELFTLLVDNGFLEVFEAPEGESINTSKLFEVFAKDEVIAKIEESKLTYYLISSVILSVNIEGVALYLPSEVTEIHKVNNIDYTLIKKSEISTILNGMSSILPIVQNVTGEGGFDISSLLENQELIDLINDSTIIGGTVVYLLLENLANLDVVTIPEELDVNADSNNMVNWLGEGKELNKLTEVLINVEEVKALLNNEPFDTTLFTNMTDESFNLMLESTFIYYNACSLIATSLNDVGMDIIIPNDSYQDNSTVLVKKEELLALKHCFKAFVDENNEFDIDKILVNSNVALESDILHATMIYYIANNLEQQIKLPVRYLHASTEEELKVNFKENYWCTTNEILHVFDSINALGISFQNFEFSQEKLMTIITGLNDEKLDTVLSSNIIWLTFGNQLASTNGAIAIPSVVYTTIDSDLYIEKSELKNLVFSLQLFGDDVDLTNFDISIIKRLTVNLDANVEMVYSSRILTFTLTNEIIKLSDRNENTGILRVPTKVLINLSENEVVITKTELRSLFVAVDSLGDQDITQIDANFITTLTVEQTDNLLASEIIHYTLSDIVLDLDRNATISVPSNVKEDLSMNSTEEMAITVVELKSMILAVQALGVSDFSAIDANIITTLESDKIDDLTSSDILRYTISVKLFAMESIVVPSSAVMSFDDEQLEKALTKVELEHIISGIKVLNITNFSEINANSILILQSNDVEKLIMSDVLQYTISKNLFDLENVIDIPAVAKEGTPQTLEALTKKELKNIILGVQTLNVESFEMGAFTANSFLSLTNEQITTICNSYTLHYTLSNKMQSVSAINIPQSSIEALSKALENEYVIKTEQIINLVNGIKILEISDLDAVNMNTLINLSDEQIDIILSSSILHYTLSVKITQTSNISIPIATKSYLDLTSNIDEIIIQSEAKNLLKSMAGLNLDMESISNISANILMGNSLDLDIVLNSDILRYTISKRVSGLTSLSIPSGVYTLFDSNINNEKAITKVELIAIVNGVNALGADLSGSEISISNIDASKIDTILNSKVLHYTVSIKIKNLSNTFTIPSIVYTTLIDEFVEKAITDLEIKQLIMDLNKMNIRLDSEAKFTSASVNAEVFASTNTTSKIIIATVSKVISSNFDVLESSRDGAITQDINETTIVVLNQAEIYSILGEFDKINLDISGGDVSENLILTAIRNGNLSIETCSNTTYLLASRLLTTEYTGIIYDSENVTYIAKGTMSSSIETLLTRAGIEKLANLVN